MDSADSASFRFGRDDTLISTTPVPIPTATGTNYSYLKYLALQVTAGGGTTSLLNRKVSWASAPPTGIAVYWYTTATYVQNTGTTGTTAGNYPAAQATNGAAPTNITGFTWAALTTTATLYDNATVAATNATRNGQYVVLTMGVDNTFTGGGGPATFPNVQFTYDEQ